MICKKLQFIKIYIISTFFEAIQNLLLDFHSIFNSFVSMCLFRFIFKVSIELVARLIHDFKL
jgi:hypothetical protein